MSCFVASIMSRLVVALSLSHKRWEKREKKDFATVEKRRFYIRRDFLISSFIFSTFNLLNTTNIHVFEAFNMDSGFNLDDEILNLVHDDLVSSLTYYGITFNSSEYFVQNFCPDLLNSYFRLWYFPGRRFKFN